jgi:exodeoxyribonuclease VII small subunit
MNEAKKQQDLPSFETAMERLEDIVSSMEGERMSLEDMVASYEEGVKLLRICRQRIDTAKQRVELITADLEGGKATLSSFEPSAAPAADTDDSDSKGKARRTKTDSQNDDIRLF